jgi:hypothetical protein
MSNYGVMEYKPCIKASLHTTMSSDSNIKNKEIKFSISFLVTAKLEEQEGTLTHFQLLATKRLFS